jgi:hypothetical protein
MLEGGRGEILWPDHMMTDYIRREDLVMSNACLCFVLIAAIRK